MLPFDNLYVIVLLLKLPNFLISTKDCSNRTKRYGRLPGPTSTPQCLQTCLFLSVNLNHQVSYDHKGWPNVRAIAKTRQDSQFFVKILLSNIGNVWTIVKFGFHHQEIKEKPWIWFYKVFFLLQCRFKTQNLFRQIERVKNHI